MEGFLGEQIRDESNIFSNFLANLKRIQFRRYVMNNNLTFRLNKMGSEAMGIARGGLYSFGRSFGKIIKDKKKAEKLGGLPVKIFTLN